MLHNNLFPPGYVKEKVLDAIECKSRLYVFANVSYTD
jgi:hypothetical protein